MLERAAELARRRVSRSLLMNQPVGHCFNATPANLAAPPPAPIGCLDQLECYGAYHRLDQHRSHSSSLYGAR
jgi:hypothetical protein